MRQNRSMSKGDNRDIMAHFEWPPDVEECIFNLIRPHVRCGLKKRTWGSLHDELLRAVDERALKRFYATSLCERCYVYLQEA